MRETCERRNGYAQSSEGTVDVNDHQHIDLRFTRFESEACLFPKCRNLRRQQIHIVLLT